MTPHALLKKLFPPMMATLAEGLPARSDEWIYELKYDGFRAVCAIVDGQIAMWSRNALDLSTRFPRVADALRKMRLKEVVIDGEVVALDPSGAPRFQMLQQSDVAKSILFAFDVLWIDGNDLRSLSLEKRRDVLKKIIPNRKKPSDPIQISEWIDRPGDEAIEIAAERGYEGLIAKLKGSRYEPRRSRNWLKLKVQNQQEFAVIGYTPSNASDREIGALLLGVVDRGTLRYAGRVGTGYTTKMRVDLKTLLERDKIPLPPAKGAPRIKVATWVRPRHVAQVRFTEWTHDGKLRHPAFLGLRFDKAPMEAVKEEPVATKSDSRRARKTRRGGDGAAGRSSKTSKKSPRREAIAPSIVLTNPDRLLYPRDGIRKEDVAAYYEVISEAMIATLDGRPLALEHWNQGIDRPSWFHQNIGREAQEWMTIAETPTRTSSKKTVRHLVADSPAALRWLAQHSVLTIHMWSSRMGSLENPDWVVFDLDPDEKKGIAQAIDTALVLRDLFEQLEIPSVPKTSGKKGIHLFVPLAKGHTHEEAADFACKIADAVSARLPYATTERSISQRKGRLYLDCMQNGYGKTMVAPYSLRAADGAPVSAPLEWHEVTKKLDPSKYNLRTMPARLEKVGDLFAPVRGKGIKIPKLR